MACNSKSIIFKSKKKALDTYLHLTERLLSQLDLTLVKAGVIAIKKSKTKVEQFHLSLCKQV